MFEGVFTAIEKIAESVVVICGFEGLCVLLVVGGILGLAVSKRVWSAVSEE